MEYPWTNVDEAAREAARLLPLLRRTLRDFSRREGRIATERPA